MRSALSIALLGALLFAPLADARAAEAPKVVILDMPVVGQEKNVWCWAAVTQMVLYYLRPLDYPKQCELVSGVVSRREGREIDCCDPEIPEADDKTCTTLGEPVLSEVGSEWYRKGNARCDFVESEGAWRHCEPSQRVALSWPKLKGEIDQGRPVVLSWRHDDGASHIMVATGYVNRPPGVQWVVINDPWPPHLGSRYLVPYDVFVSGPYKHYWDEWKIGSRIGR